MRLALLFVLVGAISGCSRELPRGEHNNFHPYGIEHATLHFEYFGDIRGTEDVFVDSFGDHEAQDTHSELITPEGFRPTYNYTIRDFGNLTVVDSAMHAELKLIDRPIDSLFRLTSSAPRYDSAFLGLYERRGYAHTGDTTVLGLPAHIWTRTGTPSFLLEWRGLLVGTKDFVQDHEHELRLISIDTSRPIDPAKFIPPSGFPVRDLTNLKPGETPPPLHP